MATIPVRNVLEKTRRELKRRAARNGRSMEAEVRMILDEVAAGKAELKATREGALTGPEVGLSDYEKQILTPTQQEATLYFRKIFARKPGEESIVDQFLRERRDEAERE